MLYETEIRSMPLEILRRTELRPKLGIAILGMAILGMAKEKAEASAQVYKEAT